jgi:hypothetical protein
MDAGYNDRAYDRAIVMHGADYVSPDFIHNHKRLGRSWGCPAVPVALARPIINRIKGGTCLYIFYPDGQYLASSKWLNSSQELRDTGFSAGALLANDRNKAKTKPRVLANASLDQPNELKTRKEDDEQAYLYQGVRLQTGSHVE